MQVISTPPLIGREREIETLERFLSQESSPGALLISGEAGLGKSRLVDECKSRARSSGWLTLHGECFEHDRLVPFSLLSDLLRTTTASPDQESWIVRAAENLGARIDGFADQDGNSVNDSDLQRRRLFESVAEFFVHVSGRGPLLATLEDLHWADDLSVEALIHLVRRLQQTRIRLVMSHRSEEAHPVLDHIVTGLKRKRAVTQITLRSFSEIETGEMLQAILDLDDPPISDVTRLLFSITEGNPFFIEEVVEVLAQTRGESVEGWVAGLGTTFPIPDSIRNTVARQLSSLSGDGYQFATRAAVAGRRVEPPLMKELLDLDESGYRGLAEEAADARLLMQRSGRLEFRHGLTRRAVYERLLDEERVNLHGAIADALERLEEGIPERYLADLSHHCYEGELWNKARRYGRRAGDRARAFHSPRAAAEHYGRALGATERLSLPPDPDLLSARAESFEMIGDLRAARGDYEAALRAWRLKKDRKGEWRALLDLGSLLTGIDYDEAGHRLTQALDLARSLEDPEALGDSLNRLGNWQFNTGSQYEAERLHREALALFERAGDRAKLATTYDLLGLTDYGAGDLQSAKDHYGRAVGLFRELDNRPSLVNALGILGLLGAHYHANVFAPAIPLDACTRHEEEALEIARDLDWPTGEAFILANLGSVLACRGHFRTALHTLHNSLAIARDIEHQAWLSRTYLFLGFMFLDLLVFDKAIQNFEEAARLGEQSGITLFYESTLAVMASVHATRGELPQAEELATRALESGSESAMTARLVQAARADIALKERRPERALSIVQKMVSDAPSKGRTILRLAMIEAEAHLSLDRVDDALLILHDAEADAKWLGDPNRRWRILALSARAHGRGGDRAAARVVSDEALGVVRALSAELDADLAEQFARGAGTFLPGRSAGDDLEGDYGGLTPREREVAALIARGLSNRGIAEELYISPQTAETHVKRILAKLGFSSRAEVAAWAVDKGIAGSA